MDIKDQIEQLKHHKGTLVKTRDSYTSAINTLGQRIVQLRCDYLNIITGNNPLVVLKLAIGKEFSVLDPMRYKAACELAESHMRHYNIPIAPVANIDGYEHRYEKIPGSSLWGAMIDLVPLRAYPDDFEFED